ncbi:hypothetical protein EZS27_035189 [termite gut metagenome]|uniref:Uncharacterized protein n=1 Tax=termite gut metagenome TaxID=433724 RepID=A0A5J4PZ63_9ZZZZ
MHISKPSKIILCFLLCPTLFGYAQTEKFPLGEYEELTDEKTYDDIDIWSTQTDTQLSWGSTDTRYVTYNYKKNTIS